MEVYDNELSLKAVFSDLYLLLGGFLCRSQQVRDGISERSWTSKSAAVQQPSTEKSAEKLVQEGTLLLCK